MRGGRGSRRCRPSTCGSALLARRAEGALASAHSFQNLELLLVSQASPFEVMQLHVRLMFWRLSESASM